ncbi:GNAT family N-acetyltransferase [Paenibacillus mesophilus]|uniref:GNAT family N-acetyltransferase n=1 Tax=Paenibacillus mesophilus TaxID=2582849 RepID=UPI00110DB595|nr:GNAT family N-acetyltransferase [Paenibacillus mesophilus]TMV51944.1 GNAT family N-acetyltransferase [Paenibacillus mesophilus]
MYTCRPVRHEDFAVICTFPQSEEELFFMFPSGTYPLAAAQLEEAASKRWCPTVVTDDNGELAGYANFYGYEEGKHCSLGNLIVAPQHRGKGAAVQLLQSMIEQARNELSVPRLLLVCHHTNPRALLFYNKLGFTPCGMNRMTNRSGEIIVGIQMEMKL